MLKNANDFILRYDMFYDMLLIKYNPQSFTETAWNSTLYKHGQFWQFTFYTIVGKKKNLTKKKKTVFVPRYSDIRQL